MENEGAYGEEWRASYSSADEHRTGTKRTSFRRRRAAVRRQSYGCNKVTSGRPTWPFGTLRQRMVLAQLEIGARKVLDVSLEANDVVLLDDVGAKGRVHLRVALGVKHLRLPSRRPSIAESVSHRCDRGHIKGDLAA
jgi:hypothetical protein